MIIDRHLTDCYFVMALVEVSTLNHQMPNVLLDLRAELSSWPIHKQNKLSNYDAKVYEQGLDCPMCDQNQSSLHSFMTIAELA